MLLIEYWIRFFALVVLYDKVIALGTERLVSFSVPVLVLPKWFLQNLLEELVIIVHGHFLAVDARMELLACTHNGQHSFFNLCVTFFDVSRE